MQAIHHVQSATLDDVRTKVVRRCMKIYQSSETDANAAWQEFVRFLSLCGSSQESLAPSQIIDKVWHEAILHTREYEILCKTVAERFVHHVPSEAGDDDTAYRRTLALLTKTYGTADTNFWPSPESSKTDCDDGGGGDDCVSSCSNCGSKCGDR